MSLFLIDGDSEDPAMRYESIARAAFDGKRGSGPNGEADAAFFDSVFTDDRNPKKIEALRLILSSLILKTTGGQKQELEEILESLSSTKEMNQGTAIDCIDLIIRILEDNA